MSRTFDMIGKINDSKETFKLAVRIIDLWWVQLREQSKHLEMILMDGKGDKIHAIVKKEDVQTWESELEEGKTYYMYNFRVVANDGQYKVCPHPYKLFFIGGTILRKVNLPDIPVKSYVFKSFEEILSGDYDGNLLIDIMGVVEEVKLLLPNASPPKVVFCLKDFSSQIVTCTLWGDHATKFILWFREKIESGYMIILLTQARIKPAQGVFGLSISNSLYGSKLLLNEEVPDFAIHKERLSARNLDADVYVSQSLSLDQQSQGSQYTDLERFLYKSTVLGLSDMSDANDGSILCTFRTTSRLIAGKGGWFYHSCGRCTKKADYEDESYTCSCGKFNEKSLPRYRVEVMVCHGKCSGNFVFWDRDCSDIVGMTASTLRTLMIQSEEGDPKHFPEPLDKLLGLTLAIRCKFQKKYNSYSVLKISDNSDIIKAIVAQIGSQKVVGPQDFKNPVCKDNSNMKKPFFAKTEQSEGCSSPQSEASPNDGVSSLSATADNDIEEDVNLTPTKRSSSEISLDQSVSITLPPAQSSAKKILKHVKGD